MTEIHPHSELRKQAIARLQKQIRARERHPEREVVAASTGCEALDRLFPFQGIRRGSLVEWIAQGEASGAGTLSLLAGQRVCPAGKPFILVDLHRQISPLALAALGFDLSRLVIVWPDAEREALWVCEEALRCEAVGLVWANIERLTSTSFRRLQLAAEETGSIGFLMRSPTAVHQPSWAEVRLLVGPRPTGEESAGWRVDVISSQGRATRSVANVKINRFQGTIDGFSHPAEADFVPLVS